LPENRLQCIPSISKYLEHTVAMSTWERLKNLSELKYLGEALGIL
jgi:hypothetical protein